MVNVAGLIINIIMGLFIITLIILGVIYNNQLNICIKNQSPLCYSIACPCDNTITDTSDPNYKPSPCKGNAKKKYADGQWICANATRTVVNDEGKTVKTIF
jgi:hypothetical protein